MQMGIITMRQQNIELSYTKLSQRDLAPYNSLPSKRETKKTISPPDRKKMPIDVTTVATSVRQRFVVSSLKGSSFTAIFTNTSSRLANGVKKCPLKT